VHNETTLYEIYCSLLLDTRTVQQANKADTNDMEGERNDSH